MAHTIKSLITPALLREIQEFWFLNSTPEACVISPQENVQRWFMGGEALDRECVYAVYTLPIKKFFFFF